ncbi:phage antirepressor N-terminal domain-containing protein [Carboxylicivirga marina]|uniref:phage antirepressor N-terminal domain-containing protein n=1 Tax=Carboxylicivirga marina TaxID=2800988 RepID=UPI002595EF3B|nr:phage antirepressor N-terminal domain-containing protein [uncultured Carboxylicivirga sp.]
MDNKTKTVAKVNDVSIVIINDKEKHVPIKPICEALNIDPKRQIDKIKHDDILSSVGGLKPSVGADGKTYEMFCLPYMYIFGWIFTINPKNVKEEAKANVLKYKIECYKVLFNHFTDQGEFLELKQKALEKQLKEVERIRNDYSNQKKQLADARKTLNQIKEMTFEQWRFNKRQLSIDFQK